MVRRRRGGVKERQEIDGLRKQTTLVDIMHVSNGGKMSCLVGMRSRRPLACKDILRGGRPQGILAWQTDGEIVDGLFLSPPPLWDLLLVTPSGRRDTGQVWSADELRERTIVQRLGAKRGRSTLQILVKERKATRGERARRRGLQQTRLRDINGRQKVARLQR